MKNSLSIALLLILCTRLAAQLSITNGQHSLEVSGMASAFFKYRIMQPAYKDDKANNLFELRDAQLQLEGRYSNFLEYELQADFADLFNGLNDPENPGLMDAYVKYNVPKALSIQAGFTKIPYGRANMVPFLYSPFIQRAEIARGQVFGSRDVGLTLSYTAWKQLVNIYAGVYSGQAEQILKGSNDRSGSFEYVGRVDFSYPVKNRYVDADLTNSPIPSFSVGANGRYVKRKTTLYDTYALKVVAGDKITYGFDVSFKYRGLALQMEWHQLHVTPTDTSRLYGYRTNYFKTTGYYAQISYYNKTIRSLFALRFDELNQTDLLPGYGRRLTVAYGFLLKGFNQMLKFNYTRTLSEEITPQTDQSKWLNQFKIGWVCAFK